MATVCPPPAFLVGLGLTGVVWRGHCCVVHTQSLALQLSFPDGSVLVMLPFYYLAVNMEMLLVD